MKPGDFVEWLYEHNNKIVDESEILWSTVLKRYVHIGCRNNLLISIHDEVITWLNDKGLFHACVDDTAVGPKLKLQVSNGCSTRVWNNTPTRIVPKTC